MTESHKQTHQNIHNFLKKHPMGVLSTVSEDGKPWGAAIYYIADEDFNIYFVTRSETYKYQNLEKNPQVALTVADSEEQITVQLSGEVSKMPVQKYMDVFVDKFLALRPKDDHFWAPPIDKVHEGNYMPLQITPTKMQYADFGKYRLDVRANYIESIIPAED